VNVEEANIIVALAEGFWPTPAMTEPETVAWFGSLGEPDMRPGDVQTVLRRMARSGRAHRPRIGEVVAAGLPVGEDQGHRPGVLVVVDHLERLGQQGGDRRRVGAPLDAEQVAGVVPGRRR